MTISTKSGDTSSGRSLKTTFLALLANMQWAFRLTWSTSPLLVSGVVVSTCGRALMPAGLDIACFEDHRFHDVMERARQDTPQHFSQFLLSIIGIANNGLQLLSLLAILVIIEPLITAVLVPVALPYLIFQLRLSRTRHFTEQARTTGRRWTSYFVRLLTDAQTAAEVTLLDLVPLLINRYRTLITDFRFWIPVGRSWHHDRARSTLRMCRSAIRDQNNRSYRMSPSILNRAKPLLWSARTAPARRHW